MFNESTNHGISRNTTKTRKLPTTKEKANIKHWLSAWQSPALVRGKVDSYAGQQPPQFMCQFSRQRQSRKLKKTSSKVYNNAGCFAALLWSATSVPLLHVRTFNEQAAFLNWKHFVIHYLGQLLSVVLSCLNFYNVFFQTAAVTCSHVLSPLRLRQWQLWQSNSCSIVLI